MNAKEYAAQAFEKIRDRLEINSTVQLVEYKSLEDHRLVMGYDALPLLDQREQNSELAILIWFAGHDVEFTQIDPPEFFQWLEERENTQAMRAAFVGWVSAGRPDNYGSIGGVEEI